MQTLSTEHRVIVRLYLPKNFLHEKKTNILSHDKDRWLIRTNWRRKTFKSSVATYDSADKSTWSRCFQKMTKYSFEASMHSKTMWSLENMMDCLDWILEKDQEQWALNLASRSSRRDWFQRTTVLHFYNSLLMPLSYTRSEYDYDIESRKETLLKEDPVLGDFKKDNYKSERVWITATDGTKVPVSIVYHKDLDRSKAQPLYLYGYGSYGASLDPWFSVARLSLLDRGVIYAIAHIRGGQELGRQWYENGKLFAKRNTFTDFIDAAKNLIKLGYTSSNLLAVSGGSAGGLHIGAVINMIPDLFEAAVAKSLS